MGAPIKHIDPKEVYKLAAQGLNKGMICQGLNVDYKTFDRRMKDNSEISTALKRGQDASIQTVENTLYTMATSGKHVVATIFFLKNANPDKYKDVHDVKHTGNLNITTGFQGKTIEHKG
jgi:hypothetical protein